MQLQHTCASAYTATASIRKHCNTLQHPAAPCNTQLQNIRAFVNTAEATTQKKQCNTLQHTATHCNTLLQHTGAFADVAIAATRKIGRSSSKELDKSSAVDAPVSQHITLQFSFS